MKKLIGHKLLKDGYGLEAGATVARIEIVSGLVCSPYKHKFYLDLENHPKVFQPIYEEETVTLDEKLKEYDYKECLRKEISDIARQHFLEVFDEEANNVREYWDNVPTVKDVINKLRKALEEG